MAAGRDQSEPNFVNLRSANGSGKRATLPPPAPLRTGRESFPSSGSSQCKAPPRRSRFHDGLIPACLRLTPNFLRKTRSLK